MMARQAAILCGGLGSRLGDLTRRTPKPLLAVNGRPFLDVLIETVARQGVYRILLLAAFEHEQVKAYAADAARRLALDIEVEVAIEPDRAGTGGAIWHARDSLDDLFFLLNGDSFFDLPLARLAEALQHRPEALGALALREIDAAGRYGVVETDSRTITRFLDAAPDPTAPATINAGVYLLRKPLVLAASPNCSLERDVLPPLATRGALTFSSAAGAFIDIGIPADFERAQTEIPRWQRRPAVFFDRDGVLNRDLGHVGTIDRFEWTAGAKSAIRRVNDAGYYAFVVTNQAGIGKGFYSEADYLLLRRHIRDELADVGAHIDDERFCPYHPQATLPQYRIDSPMRKPAPGMLLDLINRWSIDCSQSFLIGDMPTDLEAAARAGIRSYRFEGGNLDTFVARSMRLSLETI